MRGTVPGLRTPFPLLERLPSVYADDDLAGRFTAALDEVLAPALWTMDNLWAYLDPWLCPPDFLPWLADWVGVDLDDQAPEDVRRGLVAHAATWHRARGTATGLAEQLRRSTGCQVDVDDDCAATWSSSPSDPVPAGGTARVSVRIHAEPDAVDAEALLTLVRDAVPAHVIAVLEVSS